MANSIVVKKNDELVIDQKIVEEYKQLKTQSEKIENRVKEIETQIKNELKELVSETTQVGDFNFIIGGGFWSFEFDLEKFKKDHFALYVKYLKPKQSKETYSLKGKKAK